MDTGAEGLAVVKEWAFLVSGITFLLYPLVVLIWTATEGRLAAKHVEKASKGPQPSVKESLKEVLCMAQSSGYTNSRAPHLEKRRIQGQNHGRALGTFIAAAVLVATSGACVGFASLTRTSAKARLSGTQAAKVAMVVTQSTPEAGDVMSLASTLPRGLAVGVAEQAALSPARPWPQRPYLSSYPGRAFRVVARVANHRAKAATLMPVEVPRYATPQGTGASLWHDVDLHVKTWLDEDTGLFRYVNEMPLGSLQKFEVQPHLPFNTVEEDPKGSSRLAAFGQPVPFNYGCFPQTFRDPKVKDELYGAPGDNDPLDVLDLGTGVVGVGEVGHCRPLGAVCLIDEGQADWKILAVNVESSGPLADAKSIEDVHRIAPGRIEECLQWIDDFKRSSGKTETKLDFQIHSISTALRLIEQDHASWEHLLKEADPYGMARGLWVGATKSVAQQLPNVHIFSSRWVHSHLTLQRPAQPHGPLVNVSPAVAAAHDEMHARQRQNSSTDGA